MKTLKKIKLNQLSKAELENREMNAIRGGECFSCVCVCVGEGAPEANYPLSTHSNEATAKVDKSSSGYYYV
ncbi:MAG TPA: TIGR04149 family rSAM-modified RiPP [Flavobacterium sp.]|nr:TIGR04149 family rSAM-modified RiPP [Flavobacterium sp.]